MIYTCKYRTSGPDGDRHSFTTKIEAVGPDHLAALMKERGLGEVWDDCMPSNRAEIFSDILAREGVTPRALHHACFVGFLALKTGSVPVDWVLGDRGLIHEMAHVLALKGAFENRSLEELVAMARTIEQAIPGQPFMHPSPKPQEHQAHVS